VTKRRPILLLTLLLLAAAALGFYYVIRPHESTYQHRTVRSWLIWRRTEHGDYDVEVREKAEAALRHLGTNAIPPLLQMLRLETNSAFRLKCRAVCDKISFVKGPLLAQDENDLAQIGLHMLGDAVTNAIPELIGMCRQTNSTRLQYNAYHALDTIAPNPDSTAFLREGLTNSDVTIRRIAYDHFTRPNQPERLSILIEQLKDASPSVRNDAAYALRLMRGAAKPAVPFLVPLAGVISNQYSSGAYWYNPAGEALHAIDPETAAKVLPPPFDSSSPPVIRSEAPNPREQKPASPSQ
jgi:HEAT repeat protein